MRVRKNGIAESKTRAYRDAFVENVHELLYLGFSAIDRSQLSSMTEPDISGMICKAIEGIFDDPKSPSWVDEFDVHDDPPVHQKKRLGKHRRRVDIKLVSRRTRPRLRFCLEAKVLNPNGGAGRYLGADGLGRFLDGSYAAREAFGGMLAYVQSDDCKTWSEKVGDAIKTDKHNVARGGSWKKVQIIAALAWTFQTIHTRPQRLNNIRVIHTFLDCA